MKTEHTLPADDLEINGLHLSEVKQFFGPGDEEEIVNEQEQNEVVNTEEENQTTNANG